MRKAAHPPKTAAISIERLPSARRSDKEPPRPERPRGRSYQSIATQRSRSFFRLLSQVLGESVIVAKSLTASAPASGPPLRGRLRGLLRGPWAK